MNHVPVGICIFSPTDEKAHVGRKIALAYVQRLAEHLHARSLITVKPGQAYLPSLLGSFSTDDGNGSENVTLKMSSLFFKV